MPWRGKRTLAEVRDAAGHANVGITSAYLHVAVTDDALAELLRFPASTASFHRTFPLDLHAENLRSCPCLDPFTAPQPRECSDFEDFRHPT